MNPRRLPIGVFLIIPVIAGLGVYAFTGQQPVEPAPGAETPTETPTGYATPSPTATFSPDDLARQTQQAFEATATYEASLYPTALPEVMEHGVYHDRALVRVATGDGDCLNARWSPSLGVETSGVNVCLPEGYTGMITGPTIEVDGHWWWYMAGSGYVAEQYLEYVDDADLSQPMAPQYANAGGLIAFMRDGKGIWVMRPDGSEQRQIVAPIFEGGYEVWPTDFNWSPDGTMLSYNVTIWPGDGGPVQTRLHIVDLNGANVATFDDIAGRFWSPDGTRIAIVSTVAPDASNGGWQNTPGYVDLATSEIRFLTPVTSQPNTYMSDLPSFNYDGTLLLATYSWSVDDTNQERGFVVMDLNGAEVKRVTSTTDYYSAPTWSPTANQIALERNPGDGSGGEYAIYDLTSGTFIATMPEPAISQTRGGGCGGGGDMARVSWSRDGQRIHFGWMFGDAGTNGIWTLDVATGATSLLPVANSYNASSGPGTLMAFADWNHIFIGDSAAGFPTLLTDGRSPVWSSGQ